MTTPKFEPVNIYNYLKHLGTSSTGHNNLSLLKELIDNSFDANAKNITINKQQGTNEDGIKYYQLIYKDDGTGMNQENLYRFIQLHSENIYGGIGKFGIGGISTLVNWCDIEDKIYNKFIIIISRSEDNIVRYIKIDWNKCKTLDDYTKQVEESYIENDVSSIQYLKNENISQGTLIIIQTSEKKYMEILELEEDMQDYIDISTTYQDYLEKGKKINLFGDNIRHYSFSTSLLTDTFYIEIWKKNTMVAFSTKFGKKKIVLKYDKNKKEKEISYNNLETENWKLLCDISLVLDMPNDIYIPKKNIKNKMNKTQFDLKKWASFNNFCKNNGIDEENEIYFLAENYIRKLYIARENENNNKRILGGLEFSMNGFYNDDVNLIGLCVKKTLIFNYKFDETFGLTQQNKSIVEWGNGPIGLQQYIIKIINIWVKDKLKSRLNELDIKEESRLKELYEKEQIKKNFYNSLNLFINKKLDFYKRMKYNKFIPTYLNKPSPISAGMVILKVLQNNIKHKQYLAQKIQIWFRNQKMFSCIMVKGFIKFQNFIKWAHKYYHINRIENWYSKILFKRKIINYVLSQIVYKIKKSWSTLLIQRRWRRYIISKKSTENENNTIIIIQKYLRKYLALKIFEKEKSKENCFKNLSNNFKKNIKCPNSRPKFNLFKKDILNKLKEMENLL